MFKKPIPVTVDAQDITVTHEINVDYTAVVRTERIISHAGKTAIAVIGAAAAAKIATEIITHIAKTKIK